MSFPISQTKPEKSAFDVILSPDDSDHSEEDDARSENEEDLFGIGADDGQSDSDSDSDDNNSDNEDEEVALNFPNTFAEEAQMASSSASSSASTTPTNSSSPFANAQPEFGNNFNTTPNQAPNQVNGGSPFANAQPGFGNNFNTTPNQVNASPFANTQSGFGNNFNTTPNQVNASPFANAQSGFGNVSHSTPNQVNASPFANAQSGFGNVSQTTPNQAPNTATNQMNGDVIGPVQPHQPPQNSDVINSLTPTNSPTWGNLDFDVLSKCCEGLYAKQIPSTVETVQRFSDGVIMVHDASGTGAGKTNKTGAIWAAMNQGHGYDVPLWIVCPASLESNWKITLHGQLMHLFNDEHIAFAVYRNVKVISYEALHSQMKSGIDGQFYREVVEGNGLLVVDEIAKIKKKARGGNGTTGQAAYFNAVLRLVQLLVHGVKTQNSQARGLLLSALPGETVDIAENVLRLLGICVAPLYKYDADGSFNPSEYPQRHMIPLATGPMAGRAAHWLLGIVEVYIHCSTLDKVQADQIWTQHMGVVSKKGTEECGFAFLTQMILPRVSTWSPGPTTKVILRNGFFQLDQQARWNLQSTMTRIRQFMAANKKPRFTEMAELLTALSAGKATLFARLAAETLRSHPTAKVIIAVNRIATVNTLMDLLRDWSPMEYSGQNKKQREHNLKAFQTPGGRHRLLIVTTKAFNMGINAHDMTDDQSEPRVMFCEPTDEFNNLVQIAGRIARGELLHKDVKYTPPRMFIVYCIGADLAEEKSIFERLYVKGEVASTITAVAESRGGHTKFPNEYENYFENYDGNAPWMREQLRSGDQTSV